MNSQWPSGHIFHQILYIELFATYIFTYVCLSTVWEYGDVCVCVPNILRIHREEKGREREGELMLFDLFLVLTTYK